MNNVPNHIKSAIKDLRNKRVNMSVSIDEDLHQKMKILAIKEKKKLRELFVDIIEGYIKECENE